MRTKIALLLLLFVVTCLFSQEISVNQLANKGKHPYLLINSEIELSIKNAIKTSPSKAFVHDVIVSESERMLSKPLLNYEKVGKRLLFVSREAMRRIFFLSYSYRITNDVRYAQRAEAEMLTVCAFTDWNPSHFLDVAEMTLGVAIGYDWVYDKLSEENRLLIRTAIIEKGLKLSLVDKYNWWLKRDINWNQVCNAGMVFGALAIADNEPELAKVIVNQAIRTIPLPMKVYEPDGTYPEGYTYWGYGTTFNVLLLNAFEQFFGSPLVPLAEYPGFMQTGNYMLHMLGQNKLYFNYSDSDKDGELNPAVFWFAQKSNNNELLWNENKYLKSDNNKLAEIRYLPAALLWGSSIDIDKVRKPKSTMRVGGGENPVCLMRSKWSDTKGIFLAFKAGSPSASHGHMDVGSFVMDANGERWAFDFEKQEYESLEKNGINLFEMSQNSPRWKVFRMSNFAHNTLTFNDSLQQVKGKANIDRFEKNCFIKSASSDLTGVYSHQVRKAIRTASIIRNSFVQIKDEVSTFAKPTKMRWTLLTDAVPVLNQQKQQIVLQKNNKKLVINIKSTENVTLKTWTTKSPNYYDADNGNRILVGFETMLPENSTVDFEVNLKPF